MESPSNMEQVVLAEDDHPQPPENMEDHVDQRVEEESAPESVTDNLLQSASDETQSNDLEEPDTNIAAQIEVPPLYGPQCPEELFQSKVVEIARTSVQFESSCTEQYLKGCKWAPDGTCIVTNNSDNALRIYNLPSFLYEASQELPPEPQDIPQAVLIKEGGLILDYCWYPQMSSMDAATCCILSCSTKCPVHLWDAFDGSLRASYNPINRVDEVEGATSLVFTPDGQKFYCGSKNFIRVFDVCRPGRQCDSRELKHHQQPAEYRQPGIVSAIAVNKANEKLYAVGSYRKSVGLYAEPDGRLVCLLHGHKGGVTQLTFSDDGLKLFSGARCDNEIICWDVRSPGRILAVVQRNVATSQRVQFDLNSDGILYSGNTNGLVTVYNLNEASGENCPVGVKTSWKASVDCINGVSLHPSLPMVATGSGQRHFDFSDDDDDADDECEDSECCLKMWWLSAKRNCDLEVESQRVASMCIESSIQ